MGLWCSSRWALAVRGLSPPSRHCRSILGVSLLIIAASCPCSLVRGTRPRRLHGARPNRLDRVVAAAARCHRPLLPEMSSDFNIFITSGLIMVTGHTWIVMYNSDRAALACDLHVDAV